MSVAKTLWDDMVMREGLVQLMCDAGRAIMHVYESDEVGIETKGDDSPVTKADLAAHQILVDGLALLTPDLPVMSEEDPDLLDIPRQYAVYWLIDPLDGTKEFIKRNGEFTCNLALIEDHRTRLGFVGIPADGRVYTGGESLGALLISREGVAEPITYGQPSSPLRVVASKSHLSPETQIYLDQLEYEYEVVSVGSSLKFLLIAEGKADLYPRMGPTCEWDTAAAQAVLEGAGGSVQSADGGEMIYGKAEVLNPWFVARGNRRA
jgi:3'(2'), 5'-bisphosphate nucleotidase